MGRFLITVFLMAASAVVAPRLYSDVIVLKNGETVEGKVKAKTGTKIVLEYARGKFKSIPLSEIDKIEEKPFEPPPSGGAPPKPKKTPPPEDSPQQGKKAGVSISS